MKLESYDKESLWEKYKEVRWAFVEKIEMIK